MGFPDLAEKNKRQPAKLEFQVNNECFLVYVCPMQYSEGNKNYFSVTEIQIVLGILV